jgi:hypothetical protein
MLLLFLAASFDGRPDLSGGFVHASLSGRSVASIELCRAFGLAFGRLVFRISPGTEYVSEELCRLALK